MFAVGHLALGYLVAKGFQKALKTDINLPLVFVLSLIPDIDLLIQLHIHRGPTHSIIIMTLAFLPIFLYYRKKSIPYFAALAQHSLIGDYLASEGAQLLWPLTSHFYGLYINMWFAEGIALEWLSFLAATALIIKTGDLKTLLTPRKTNLLLAIPAGAICLSAIYGFGQGIPAGLLLPHVAFLIVFAISILNTARRLAPKRKT